MVKDSFFNSFWPETQLAIQLAQQAGDAVLEIYGENEESRLKEDKEPVTAADLKSQSILAEGLGLIGYPILSEEAEDDKTRLHHKKVWIIDPLDGTIGFINKDGDFAIQIALVDNCVPVIGIVYQPASNTWYIAQKGTGAYKWHDGVWKKLKVTSTTDIAALRAVISRNHLSDKETSFLKALGIGNCVQRGGCGLKVVEVASGNAELYFSFTNRIKQWDTCAPNCIVIEAGGNMTDMRGEKLQYNFKALNHENGILVTNGNIHQQILTKASPDFI